MFFSTAMVYQISGVSHKNEWDAFTRICSNRKVFPLSLSNHLKKDKTDLFNSWLACNKDIEQFLDAFYPFWIFVLGSSPTKTTKNKHLKDLLL